MKIGIFDSGLGGLIVLKSITKKLPQYDYVYIGDTLHMPYGNRTQKQIYSYTRKCVEFLFNQNCKLVIIACNTASAQTLKKIQQGFLPKYFPDRRVLGVIIPTVEEAVKTTRGGIGILATKATVNSKAYLKELIKCPAKTLVYQQAAPALASLIETPGMPGIVNTTKKYLRSILDKQVKTIILGCTHYSIIKPIIKKLVGKKTIIIDQTNIIPKKLALYLKRHREIRDVLSKNRSRSLYVTKKTLQNSKLSKIWFGRQAELKFVKI